MKIFVTIATYNEKENIANLLKEVLLLPLSDLNIIVIDDNSPDGTGDIVRQNFVSYNERVELISRVDKRGYGSAHVDGFKRAMSKGADVVISMDADFSHQPKTIPEMIKQIEDGYDVIVGSRRVHGGKVVGWSLTRTMASKVAMLITGVVLGIKTKDVTSGFRAYRASCLKELDVDKIESNGYSFLEELIYFCEKKKFKIFETPIIFNDRQLGKSKFSIVEVIKFFITIIKLRFNLIRR